MLDAGNKGLSKSTEDRILVFRIGSLGDTVVALPALREIRRRHPAARIGLLTNTPVDGGIQAASSVLVLQGSGLADEYFEYPHGKRSFGALLATLGRLRRFGARTCYYVMPVRTAAQTMRDRIFFRLAGVRECIGLAAAQFAPRPPSDAKGLWESEAHRLLRAIGARERALAPEDFSLNLSNAELRAAAHVLHEAGIDGRYAVMSIGAKQPVKDWGDARWRICLDSLARGTGQLALVAIGALSERARSDRLLAGWPGPNANLCGRLEPRLSAAVLSGAELFLGHDSGPMHLASAVGTRLVAVFSARNSPGVWFPYGQEHNVFYLRVPCMNCGLDDCVEQRQRCVTGIDPQDVARRARQLLAVELSSTRAAPDAATAPGGAAAA